MKQYTVYMNQTDRERAETLLADLYADEATRPDVQSPQGQPSISALFRYLVEAELSRRQVEAQ